MTSNRSPTTQGFRRLSFLVALCCTACGDSGSTPAAPAPAPAPAPARAPEPPPPTAPPEAPEPNESLCDALGYATPFTATRAQQRANRAALRSHSAGEFEASEAAFAAILEGAPHYDSVRFNHACALARLDRFEDAKAELRRLLCRDLPTNAERVRGDEDLTSVREDVLAAVPAIAHEYRAAWGDSPELIHAGGGETDFYEERSNEWAQAGAWLAETARFLPIGPRVRASLPHSSVDLVTGRVLVLRGRASDSEGGWMPAFGYSLHTALTGETLFDGTMHSDDSRFMVHASVEADTIKLWWVDEDARPPQTHGRTLSAAGAVTTRFDPPAIPDVSMTNTTAWEPSDEGTGFSLARNGQLTTPAGTFEIEIRALPHGDTNAVLDEQHNTAVIIHSQTGECSSPDRYRLAVVDLQNQRSTWSIEGRGRVRVHLQHGVLFVETLDAGIRQTLRFGDALVDDSEPLPEGMRTLGAGFDYNPYC